MMRSDWTVETLREYLLAVISANDSKYHGQFDESKNAVREAFLAQQTAMQTALTAQKLAVDMAQAAAANATNKAELAADKRFDSVNEFRASLADQQRAFMPRTEVELLVAQLAEKVNASTLILTQIAGKTAGLKDSWAYLIGAIGAAGVIASILYNLIK